MCAKKKQEMIYDHDEWLEPYKEVIDRRNKMILEMKAISSMKAPAMEHVVIIAAPSRKPLKTLRIRAFDVSDI